MPRIQQAHPDEASGFTVGATIVRAPKRPPNTRARAFLDTNGARYEGDEPLRCSRPVSTRWTRADERWDVDVAVLDIATAERRDLLELLGGLNDGQWNAPTLCTGWTVRDVAAHIVSYEGAGAAALAKQFVQGRFRLSKINAVGVARSRRASPEALLEAVERNQRPSGVTTAFGGRIALTDALIHHQDIRRSLGLPRTVPPERLRVALNFALWAPPIRGAWRVRGTRVAATDVDWSFGAGPDARASGEAVLMVMAGRRGVAEDLSGPGAQRIRKRLD
jgi:uncharacterized protein (TIGR03083 family)